MMTIDIPPERYQAWGVACRAQWIVDHEPTRERWVEAAQAWDALVALYGPHELDRAVFEGLAQVARERAST